MIKNKLVVLINICHFILVDLYTIVSTCQCLQFHISIWLRDISLWPYNQSGYVNFYTIVSTCQCLQFIYQPHLELSPFDHTTSLAMSISTLFYQLVRCPCNVIFLRLLNEVWRHWFCPVSSSSFSFFERKVVLQFSQKP